MLRLPDNITLEQLMATPETTGEDDAPPEFLFQSTFPGFPGETLAGHENGVVVDLTPGQYLIVGDSFQPFTVTGQMPVDVAPVVADSHVETFDFNFTFPDDLATGPQIWEVTNIGPQPHEILLAKSSVPITAEQVIALFSDENATPVAGGPSIDDISPVGGIGWLTPGATGWTGVDLSPGYYVALCFVFDLATGIPHAMEGMVTVFTIGNGAATPDS